jgi:hypothetical protein
MTGRNPLAKARVAVAPFTTVRVGAGPVGGAHKTVLTDKELTVGLISTSATFTKTSYPVEAELFGTTAGDQFSALLQRFPFGGTPEPTKVDDTVSP